MSAIGGVGSAGMSSGGVGGSGGVGAVAPASAPAAAETATGSTPTPGGEGPSNPSTTEGKEHACPGHMPGMNTQNFIQINNQVNSSNAVSGVGEAGSSEFDLKKLIELMIMLKLIESMSEGGQGAGQGASGQGSGGQGVGANLNITA